MPFPTPNPETERLLLRPFTDADGDDLVTGDDSDTRAYGLLRRDRAGRSPSLMPGHPPEVADGRRRQDDRPRHGQQVADQAEPRPAVVGLAGEGVHPVPGDDRCDDEERQRRRPQQSRDPDHPGCGSPEPGRRPPRRDPADVDGEQQAACGGRQLGDREPDRVPGAGARKALKVTPCLRRTQGHPDRRRDPPHDRGQSEEEGRPGAHHDPSGHRIPRPLGCDRVIAVPVRHAFLGDRHRALVQPSAGRCSWLSGLLAG